MERSEGGQPKRSEAVRREQAKRDNIWRKKIRPDGILSVVNTGSQIHRRKKEPSGPFYATAQWLNTVSMLFSTVS